MPTSSFYNLTPICEKIVKLAPKRVLDLGCGNGKWGFLTREYSDIWCERRLEKTTHIEGVEVFEKYITPAHRYVYDKIHIGEISEIIKTLDSGWDLVLCIDVLEHLPRELGIDLLRWINENSKVGILALPTNVQRRGAPHGNRYEEHICFWKASELEAFGSIEFAGTQTILTVTKDVR